MQRKSLLAALVGFALLAGCGRTEMRPLVRGAAASDAGTASPGDTAAISGPCGEATCLTSLFQTCVPEGSCALFATGGPHTSVYQKCYANGVMVSSQGGWNGTNMYRDLTVRHDDSVCYRIAESDPPSGSGAEYVITGAGDQRVATGRTHPDAGTITVVCEGGTPTTISQACLQPVDDDSQCDSNAPCP